MPQYPAPFRENAFGALAAFTHPEASRENLRAKIAPSITGTLTAPRMDNAFASSITITVGSKSSASFQNVNRAANPDPAAAHFHYVPGVDTPTIEIEVEQSRNARSITFELWSATDTSAAVWSQTHDRPGDLGFVSGKATVALDFKITGKATEYPDQIPNAANAPYQLRMVVEDNRSQEKSSAWTYFDILVHSIELHWGDKALIPNSNVPGVSQLFRATTKQDEKDIADNLRVAATAVPNTGEVNVRLRSTMAAYTMSTEWSATHDFAYLRHEARWGDGPRIPMLAKISLKKADDSAVFNAAAAKATGPLEVLWDWHDKPEAARRTTETAAARGDKHARHLAFVMDAMKYKENAGGEPPACLNCHKDRGGKREDPAKPTFLAHDGSGNFPFTAAAVTAGRAWAAVSTALSTGAHAGYTGVLFNPSRMAKDSYRLSAFVLAPHIAAADTSLDAQAGDTQSLVDDSTGLPLAQTAMIEIQRQIDARYVRKHAGVPAMDLTKIDSQFALGGVHIEWAQLTWTKVDWTNQLNDALNGVAVAETATIVPAGGRYNPPHLPFAPSKTHLRKQTVTAIANRVGGWLFNGYDHWEGRPAAAPALVPPAPSTIQFSFPDRTVVIDRYIASETKKFLVGNGDFARATSKWGKFDNKAKYAALSEEQKLVRYYNKLLGSSLRKVVRRAVIAEYGNEGWLAFDQSKPHMWLHANYDFAESATYGLAALIIELHVRKIVGDAFEGVWFFHYENFSRTIGHDGQATAHQARIGGLASVAFSADLGLKAGFCVWDHPTNLRRQDLSRTTHLEQHGRRGRRDFATDPDLTLMNGEDTAAHEFGHFLHLPHDQGAPEAKADLHDHADGQCIMNYDPRGLHLCGVCSLRVRGWARFKETTAGLTGFSNQNPTNDGGSPPSLMQTTFDAVKTEICQ